MMPQHAYHQQYQQLHPQQMPPNPQQYMQPHPMSMQTPSRPPQRHQPGVGGPTPVHGGQYAHMPPQMMPAMPTSAATPTPSSKRARPNPSMASATGASAATIAVMESIEDEEDTSRGDVLDHLTPREISTQRYIQHHEWLEEVFNSVYPSSAIIPGSIGIEKLGGPLKPLVDGVFAKDGTPTDNKSQNEACKIVIDRAKKMTADIEVEMEELKKKHAQHLEEFQKGRLYLSAEKELRNADVDEYLVNMGLTLPPLPVDRNAMAKDNRTVDEIISDIESAFDISILYRDVVYGWNPQPEIAELEEAQAREEALAKEAAAAAAAEAAAAKANGMNGADDKDKENAMADVAATESTSPENARYLVPVVIDKPDSNTGPSPNANATGLTPQPGPQASSMQQSSASPAPLPTTEDTMMSDAPTISAPLAAPPMIPTAAGTGTPGLSPNPVSPFVIPSPSPAATPLSHSQVGTPALPTPLPATAEPGKSQTPIPQGLGTPQPGASGTLAKADEPPTVPGEDEIPDGFVGGDNDDDTFNFGGGAAEAMDLLGADDSFTDHYM